MTWDADIIPELPLVPWNGQIWRTHRRRYAAIDPGGSQRSSGRFHRAPDRFPAEQTWTALYFALAPETSLAEIIRHLTPALFHRLNEYRISELAANLSHVLDCRDLGRFGLDEAALLDDVDYSVPQSIAAAAIHLGAEAILVRSATRLGDNPIVFPAYIRPHSTITITDSRDPRLYVSRG